MVEANENKSVTKKIFFLVQGERGNIGPFLTEQENLGLYNRNNPNTKLIELVYPVTTEAE